MLLNLVDNAVNHNDARGSVQLTVRADADQHGTETIAVKVDNTGPVIDQAEVVQLFELFYRFDPRVANGRTCHGRTDHGLGLAIVKSIVAVHHGTIRATANPNGGLTVEVRLPSAVSA